MNDLRSGWGIHCASLLHQGSWTRLPFESRPGDSEQPRLAQRVFELGEPVPVVADERAQAGVRGDLEPDAIGVREEGGVVVGRVLRVEPWRAHFDAQRDERAGRSV